MVWKHFAHNIFKQVHFSLVKTILSISIYYESFNLLLNVKQLY